MEEQRLLKKSYCEICNHICVSERGLGAHVRKKHGISSQKYYDKYIRRQDEGFCARCGALTVFEGIPKGYRKYCSRTCCLRSDERKEKRKTYSPWPKGKKRTREQMEKTVSQFRGIKRSEEFKQKVSKALMGHKGYWTGKKRGPYTKQHRENISKGLRNSKKLREATIIRAKKQGSFPYRGNNEVEFFDQLKPLLPFDIKESYVLYGFVVDGYIEEKKIVIEFDESYHFGCMKQIEKDHNRMLEIFINEGVRFIRVEEDDWLKNKDDVYDFIINSVNNVSDVKSVDLLVTQRLSL